MKKGIANEQNTMVVIIICYCDEMGKKGLVELGRCGLVLEPPGESVLSTPSIY